jgi:hypothetical protein
VAGRGDRRSSDDDGAEGHLAVLRLPGGERHRREYGDDGDRDEDDQTATQVPDDMDSLSAAASPRFYSKLRFSSS